MADTYSDVLRVTLMENGGHDSSWGTVNNASINLLEAAIAGRAAVTHDDTANYTLTTANGSADEARKMILNIGGALGAARNVVVPTKNKVYVVKNATTGGFAVTVKTSAGTGISVPNGNTMLLFCDGTNVVQAIDYLISPTFLTPAIGTPASGNLANCTSYPFVEATRPAFSATPASNPANVTGDGTTYTVVFGTEIFDQANNFASNTFTAPTTAKYQLNAFINSSGMGTGHTNVSASIATSNRSYPVAYNFASSNPFTDTMLNINVLADMDAGDTATVTLLITGSTKTAGLYGAGTSFSGFLAC